MGSATTLDNKHKAEEARKSSANELAEVHDRQSTVSIWDQVIYVILLQSV